MQKKLSEIKHRDKKDWKKSIGDLWYNIKSSNMFVIKILRKDNREEQKKLFEKKWPKISQIW